jgi:hypothetical protein
MDGMDVNEWSNMVWRDKDGRKKDVKARTKREMEMVMERRETWL